MSRHLLTLALPIVLAACATDGDVGTASESAAESEPVALSESAAEGRAFAEANCASCHALDDGVSPHPDAPSLRRAVNRLPAPMVAGSLEAGIQIGHTTEMPIFVFEDDDVANLFAYFQTLRNED